MGPGEQETSDRWEEVASILGLGLALPVLGGRLSWGAPVCLSESNSEAAFLSLATQLNVIPSKKLSPGSSGFQLFPSWTTWTCSYRFII